MTHIMYAAKVAKIEFDNVRLSVPISAQPIHFAFMGACARYVWHGIDVDFTTEPEAAFSYLSTLTE